MVSRRALRWPFSGGRGSLPTFQVRVYTTWAVEWAVKWEQVGEEWPEEGCFCRPEGEPIGVPHRSCPDPDDPGCGGCTDWCGQVAEPKYDWVKHEEGWYPIDLRPFGNGTWYYTSWQVCSGGAGPWCAFEYGNCGRAVPMPVIEAQSVLRDPCVLNGTCSPGYPR